MIKRNLILFIISMIVLSSCKEIVLKIDSVPSNTPFGQPIYVSGNFNSWDPGDDNFMLQMAPDSNYYYTLPAGFGTVMFKFTRGDWKTVEKGICGEEIKNRFFETANQDTVTCQVESWGGLDPVDCPKLTLKITNIPENTPVEDIIAMASSNNAWNPDDASIFETTSSGDLFLSIDRPPGITKIDYKITRGDISNCESDEYGNDIPNRTLEFGKMDTVEIDIVGWTDLQETKSNRVTIIINQLPKNTYLEDGLFLACNLNSWSSGNTNYQFVLNKDGNWFYPVPRRDMTLEYKVTRGDWSSVETDWSGNDIMNRSIDLLTEDTVYIDIKSWKDIYATFDNEVTIILKSVPKTTPKNAKFYLSGGFSDWNPGRLRYKFRQNDRDQYFVNIPRENQPLEFKITRGSWETTEVGQYGENIPISNFDYGDFDTIYVDVLNWADKPFRDIDSLTLIINGLPENTNKDKVYLAPDFNGWNPGDRALIFNTLPDGRPVLTFPAFGSILEYKITRGNWRTVEVDENFDDIDDRIIYYGFSDTVYIDVKNWSDYR